MFSFSIDENSLKQFERSAKEHLSGMVNDFKARLKPKHHHFLHCPTVIRQMGPIRLMWMMKYDAKHKFFTDEAKKTNNFVNITKTLADSHQAYMCNQKFHLHDEFKCSQKSNPFSVRKISEYEDFVSQAFDTSKLVVMDSITLNGKPFRKGLMIIHESKVSEIIHVLKNATDFYLFCHVYQVIEFEQSLNSFKIEKPEINSFNCLSINLKDLSILETFEKKPFRESYYLIADRLDIFTSLYQS